MRVHISTYFWAILLLIGHQAVAQDEFFQELAIEKQLLETEKWELAGEINWKYIYSEPRWRRWGVSVAAVRNLGRFRLLGGGNAFYTFNSKITNFFELRPWWAAQLALPLAEGLVLRQRFKSEWRYFFEEGNHQRENYGRLRYQLAFDIHLSKEDKDAWKLRPSIEWFFLRNPSQFERFSNERDLGLRVFHELPNEHELSFGYLYEAFLEIDGSRERGHTLIVTYTF